MNYRNILVQVDESAGSSIRVKAAATVAARNGASLTGVFLRSDFVPAIAAGDVLFAASALEAYIEERDRNMAIASEKARNIFELAVAEHEVPADWAEINGDDNDEVLAAARRFDLTVFPNLVTSNTGSHAIRASHIGMGSGAPVLILPERSGYQIPFGKRVLVAWKESREAARALRDAWPLITAADEVHFVSISRDAPDDFDDMMRRNLEAHGCRKITMHADRNDDVDVATALQRHSGRVGADLVVLGLYGHSRMREMMLGGVSRGMLEALHLPLLVSH